MPWATAWPASTPVPTTTSSSPSPIPSSAPAFAPSAAASDVDRTRHEPVLQLGIVWILDEAARQVRVADEPVDLSQREFALLECLMHRHPDQVLTRDQLLDHAWPMAVAVMPNTVDQYVSFVRRKLGPGSERIETVRGVGYRMTST